LEIEEPLSMGNLKLMLKRKVLTGQTQSGLHHNQTLPEPQRKYLSQIQLLTNPEPILHLILETEELLSMLKHKEMINQKEPIKVSTN
jgi:hypothetical protein